MNCSRVGVRFQGWGRMSNKARNEQREFRRSQKRGLIPKLRFPEFRDAGEWEEKQVGEVFKVTRGEVLSMTLVQDEKTNEARYPVYSSQTKNNGLSGYYSDFLYEDAITWTTDGANAGDVNYRSGKFYCTNVCGVLINTNGYANPCIAALINSVSRSHVSYVGNPKLMNGVMAKITIPFPTVEEQQKIADCLASLDERISLEAQKLDTLKTHKKGLMQQLFPAEGETLPKLRFPEFRDAGEWKEKKLTDAITPVIREVAKPDSSYLALGLRSHGKGTFHKPDQAPEKNSMDKLYLVHHDDLIVNITFAWEGAIAIAGKQDHGCYVSHRFPTYVFNEKVSTSGFFRYVIIKKAFIYKLGLISPGGAGRNRVMNKKDLLQLTVLLPDTKEQQKIADCLASLDDLITAQTQKLAALKTHKKGLMQQLFPALDEVAA